MADGPKNPYKVNRLSAPGAAHPQGLRPFGLGAVLIPVDVVEIAHFTTVGLLSVEAR